MVIGQSIWSQNPYQLLATNHDPSTINHQPNQKNKNNDKSS